VVALRAVQTSDFIDRRLGRTTLRVAEKVSSRIINECAGINRVTYDVSSKPPATIDGNKRRGANGARVETWASRLRSMGRPGAAPS